MLHHKIIPWSPERMRRLILSLICSSGKAANVPKPTSVDIASSQIRIAFFCATKSTTLSCSVGLRDPLPAMDRAPVSRVNRQEVEKSLGVIFGRKVWPSSTCRVRSGGYCTGFDCLFEPCRWTAAIAREPQQDHVAAPVSRRERCVKMPAKMARLAPQPDPRSS
jgi:hypothetical protein